MLEDKAAARHRLEVCMTTKRVMLPLMRESCMAALRAEFEAHARRLLGATAATMQSPAPAMPQVGVCGDMVSSRKACRACCGGQAGRQTATPAAVLGNAANVLKQVRSIQHGLLYSCSKNTGAAPVD